jgi:hypothetical protein
MEAAMTAGQIAKQKFESYLEEELKNEWDSTVWEFYTWLLKKAQSHSLDTSGYESCEYQRDEKIAAGY